MIKVRIRNGLEPHPDTGLGGANEGYIRGSINDIMDVIGVPSLSAGHLLVTETSPQGLSVSVAPGVGYIPNSAYDQLNIDTQKYWEAVNDDDEILVVAANTSGSTRIDLICLKLDTTVVPDEYASNIGTLVVVQGTPGAGAPATPSNHLLLAEVTIINGETTIANADISDERVQSTLNADFLGTTAVPVKTTGAAIDTGTNDTDFATPKALKDSHNVPSVAPGTAGNVMQSDGTDWVSAAASAGGTSFWNTVPGTPTRVSDTQFTITDTANANLYDLLFKKGVILKWDEGGTFQTAMVISSSYSSNVVTINVVGDSLTAGFTAMKYSIALAMVETFIIPGTISAGTDIAKTWKTKFPTYIISADAWDKTAGTTNATVFDINIGGSTKFTTKPSIASAATEDNDNVADTPSTVVAEKSLVTVDCDSVSTTAPIEAYIDVYYYPQSWRYRT